MKCKNCGNIIHFSENEKEKRCPYCQSIVINDQFVNHAKQKNKKSIDDVMKSVLTISTDAGHGTGFIINEDGYVITNAHLVNKEDILCVGTIGEGNQVCQMEVIADGSVVGVDLSILKIINPIKTYQKLSFMRTLERGDACYTIGNALHRGLQLSKGYISVPRTLKDESIQVNISGNTGNSGGPLLNENGQVLGIITYTISELEGMAFAISSDKIMRFLTHNDIAFKEE